jgi:alditol oxidase
MHTGSMPDLSNWAENLTYSATKLHRPSSIDEVREVVFNCDKARPLGTRHAFNEIADTPHDLISLENLNQVVSLDQDTRTVTVEGGIKYGDLCAYLSEQGYGLPNLASLPHISIAGACATATHGSGDQNGNLATAVSGIQLVKADGSIVKLRRGDEDFNGAVVNLGALGVAVRLTLDMQYDFQVRQIVFQDLPFEQMEMYFHQITCSAYSVSMFTHWRGIIDQVWQKHTGPILDPEYFFGATPATQNLHPIKDISPVNCTEQMGVPGPWHERLPHFRMDYTPSNGEELQSEYLVPRHYAVEALRAINELGEQISPHLHISEIRTIAEDELWMSPCYGQGCVGIHFTWKKDWASVSQLLPVIEEKLSPFEAKPHWGKLFHRCPLELYQRVGDFKDLAQRYDPQGKFRNAFLDRHVFV